jgi:S1-C subfamily serine protease
MMKKSWVVILVAIAALAGATLGCGLPGEVLLQPTALPATTPTPVPATPTTAPPQVSAMTEEPANALEGQVVAVYESAGPAVVNISTVVIAYDFFMRPVPQEGGTGSGFVYDADGHIVTNYHVVENAEELSVTLADGEVYPAEIVGVDPSNDLAVVRIDVESLPQPVALGDSDGLRVGEFVVAIGNPFGLERTLTVGVISSLGRVIQSPDGRFIGEAIQTDAAINPGNSGGPLLDLEGRVIGVNSQIISPSRASAGIGFAVPVNTVKRVVPQLIAQGRYAHPWLGVEPLSLTPERAQAFREAGMDVPVDKGLLMIEVVPGGPADQAGIRGGDRIVQLGNVRLPLGGDIITAINGEAVDDLQELTVYLETQTQVGDTVEVTIFRGSVEQSIAVTLAERPQ